MTCRGTEREALMKKKLSKKTKQRLLKLAELIVCFVLSNFVELLPSAIWVTVIQFLVYAVMLGLLIDLLGSLDKQK